MRINHFVWLSARARRRTYGVLTAALATTLVNASDARANLGGTVSFIPIATNAYGVDDTNSVGVERNNLATVGNYQYTAYYQYVSKSTGKIVVGRRATGSSSWSLATTPYQVVNGTDALYSGAIDDHDTVAMAVDGNGAMHLSWGMHNIPLNYAISSSVTGSTFAPTFTTQTAANNPNLFSPFTSTGISQATYPEFYYTPDGSGAPGGNLLFDIRNSASSSGGGSGNGNTYFGTYNASSHAFSQPEQILNGGQTSVNGYQNSLVYDHAGNLLYTWTWRSTSAYQTNHNILFAQSPDSGVTWTRQGGSPNYTLPIISDTSNGGSASQVAQVIANIPQNSSLINTTGMTVDANNNPIVATWWAPGSNSTQPVSASNNPNLQYMLVYYTGSQWKTSQISHRTSDTSFDNGGNFVRDMGRPLTMVDAQGRVLVVTRSEDTAIGSYKNAGTPGNNIVVYWNTVASLDSATPNAWQSIALDTANMGEWEPTFDQNLWAANNTLDLFYEPVGITGQTTGTAQVLQWNEQTYFQTATPASLTFDANAVAGIQDGSGTWDATHTNFSDGAANYVWNNNFATSATFGSNNGPAGVVTLGSNITAQTITFNAASSGNYNIAGGGFTLTLSSGAVIRANVDATISAPITASGTLIKTGAGTLTLTGANSLGGTLQLGSGVTAGGNVDGAVRITSAPAVGGLTLVTFADYSGAYTFFQIDGSTGDVTLPSTLALNMGGSPSATALNTIENIAGNNIINGAITPQVGGNQYGVQSDAGTLTINSNFSLGTLTSQRFLNLMGAGNGQWNGSLSDGNGSLGINKAGAGTWTLSNTNTYTGTTSVNGGTLTIAASGSLASPAISVASGATLLANGSLATSTALTALGTVTFGAGNNNSGILNRTLSSMVIGSSGQVSVLNPTAHPNRTLLVTSALTFAGNANAWQGQLDLGENDLLVHNGDLPTISNQIQAGYNIGAGGYWNGPGIASSTAAGDLSHVTALGVIVNNDSTGQAIYGNGATLGLFDGLSPALNDVLVKFTYYGDANLDGRVDGSDYTKIDNGYATQLTGWYNGDFNYDGVVDGSDYTLIDNAFNVQGGNLTTSSTNLIANVTAQLAGSSVVPEPTSLGLAAIAVLPMLRRRPARCGQMPV